MAKGSTARADELLNLDPRVQAIDSQLYASLEVSVPKVRSKIDSLLSTLTKLKAPQRFLRVIRVSQAILKAYAQHRYDTIDCYTLEKFLGYVTMAVEDIESITSLDEYTYSILQKLSRYNRKFRAETKVILPLSSERSPDSFASPQYRFTKES